MESYTLFQLNEYVRRVIALNFREPLWIEAEIAQIKDSRGNQYLELIEKDEEGEGVIAQCSAAIWYRQFQFIKRKLGDIVYDLLEEGTQVRLKCKVDFHERYGFKLIIEDIDPNYTFGKLELKRQEIINKLEDGGLMDLNKGLIVPSVIQKIAVISSATAAGYQDFKNQLLNNGYGYTFKIDLFDGAVQGVNVEANTLDSIKEILSSKINYDVVAVIRGGGSKLDLSGFDNYKIAEAIALSEIPFVIGIGHDIDSTVTDLVACLSLKTPTAVADYVIDRNMSYEARLEQQMASIHRSATNMVRNSELALNGLKEQIRQSAQYKIAESNSAIELSQEHLRSYTDRLLSNEQHQLEKLNLMIDAKDPIKIMTQGYSYVMKGKKVVQSVKKLKSGDRISVHLNDGQVDSTII